MNLIKYKNINYVLIKLDIIIIKMIILLYNNKFNTSIRLIIVNNY